MLWPLKTRAYLPGARSRPTPASAEKEPSPAGRNSILLSSQVAEPEDAVVLNRIGAPTNTGRGVQSTNGRSGPAASAMAGVTMAPSSTPLRVIVDGPSGIVTRG